MNLPPDALRPCSRCIYRVVRDEKEWCRFPGSDNEMKTKEARHTDGHCQADGLHYVENPVIRRENSVLWH